MKYYLIDITYNSDTRYPNVPHSLAEAKQIALDEVNKFNGKIIDIHSEHETYEEIDSGFRTGCLYPHGNKIIVGNLTVIYLANKKNFSAKEDDGNVVPTSEITDFILRGKK